MTRLMWLICASLWLSIAVVMTVGDVHDSARVRRALSVDDAAAGPRPNDTGTPSASWVR